ncbi:MAG TPA: transcriptional activator RfaH [Alphaproteobacteria bacterium]|nr:transcriptional activator RfaH [Alphaproteobacteria bacterium]
MSWYAVSTRAHQEARAAQHLARQGFEVWLPQIRKTRRHARRTEIAPVALFPGYLFVVLDPVRRPWRAINGTCGVQRLICRGDRPVAVPEGFIDELHARQDAEGFIPLPETEFRTGDVVRLRDGPFVEHVATILRVEGRDRVWLLLDVLGRRVMTGASCEDIVAAA